MTAYTHKQKRAPKIKAAPFQSATEALGLLEHGGSMFGFTKGQFSFQDLIKAVLAQTGPAHLTVSTWTAGAQDVGAIGQMITAGEVLSMRLLIDRSFPTRQPKYVAQIREVFGDGCIFLTRTHAKFALIRNERWNIVIRTSMNLNRNPRFEQFDLDDSADLMTFMESHVEDIAEQMTPGMGASTKEVDQAFRASLGGGLSEACELELQGKGAGFDFETFIAQSMTLDL